VGEKVSARQKLLQAAGELFYRNGLAATGIDAITARAGVAKMSLYNNFDSKADLASAYIDDRCMRWRANLDRRIANASTHKERVLAVFDSYLDQVDADGAEFRGCGLLNAAAELGVAEPARTSVVAQKNEVEKLFRDYLNKSGADAAAVAVAAEHLSLILEGGIARAGLEGNGARLLSARKIAATIVDQLAGSSR
jgi:AcrR family transcriptional regulator